MRRSRRSRHSRRSSSGGSRRAGGGGGRESARGGCGRALACAFMCSVGFSLGYRGKIGHADEVTILRAVWALRRAMLCAVPSLQAGGGGACGRRCGCRRGGLRHGGAWAGGWAGGVGGSCALGWADGWVGFATCSSALGQSHWHAGRRKRILLESQSQNSCDAVPYLCVPPRLSCSPCPKSPGA